MDRAELEGKSAEELEAILRDPSVLEEPPASPEPPPAPAAETVVTEESPTPEAEETPTEPEPPAEGEAPPAEVPDEERIRLSLVEELKSRAKHFEAVAGRNAGELGFVKKQLQELQSLLAAPPSMAEPDVDEPPRRPVVAERRLPDSTTAWAVSTAVQNALAQFGSTHQDLQELQPVMAQYLQAQNYDAKALIESGDPHLAGAATSRALDEAYWFAKAQQQEAVRVKLEEKKADQIRNLHKAKLRGGPTASGASPAPPPPPKTLQDMSIPELQEELRRLTR